MPSHWDRIGVRGHIGLRHAGLVAYCTYARTTEYKKGERKLGPADLAQESDEILKSRIYTRVALAVSSVLSRLIYGESVIKINFTKRLPIC